MVVVVALPSVVGCIATNSMWFLHDTQRGGVVWTHLKLCCDVYMNYVRILKDDLHLPDLARVYQEKIDCLRYSF